MPPNIFNVLVNIKRSTSQGRDSLNNPIYGTPTSGAGWSTAYSNMPAKLAFSSDPVRFAMTGEKPDPRGVMYYPNGYILLPDDRVLTTDAKPIEYVVVSVVPAYVVGAIVHHYEAMLQLPT